MSRAIPTINTSRLTLRAMRPEDFARYAEIWAMPEVYTHIDGAARSKSRSWDAFLRNAGHWQISGFGQWAVQVHGQTEMSGQAGFFFGSRELGEDFDPYAEAGWLMTPETHGQGLGYEAAAAAHDWFDRIVATRTVCVIDPKNAASLRIADKLGYMPLRDVDLDGATVHLLTRKGPKI